MQVSSKLLTFDKIGCGGTADLPCLLLCFYWGDNDIEFYSKILCSLYKLIVMVQTVSPSCLTVVSSYHKSN